MKTQKTIVRILCFVLAAVLVLGLIPAVALAATPSTLYFQPSNDWKNDSARFAAYFFEGDAEAWASMTDSDGDGVYECAIPGNYAKVIFVRMDPSNTNNNWDNKWNQTADLSIPTDGKNCFAVNAGEWDGANGTWSTIGTGCAHSYDAGTVTTAATCTTAGVKTYTCTLCSETKTETIPALDHNYVDGVCSNCGAVQAQGTVIYFDNTSNWSSVYAYAWSDSDKQLGTWPGTQMTAVAGVDGRYSITVPAGAVSIIFNNGGNGEQTDDLVIPTDGKNLYTGGSWDSYGSCAHSYELTSTTAATCTSAGVKTYTCSKCSETKTETIPALDHNYVDGVCSNCGAVQAQGTVIYFDNTSNWSAVYAYAWSDSDKQLGVWPGTQMTAVAGVDGRYSITVPAGAVSIIFNNGGNGEQTGDLVIPTDGNNLYTGSGWSYYSTCSHDWGDGAETTAPTCTTDGVKTYTCSKCSETKTETIAALGHNYVDGSCTRCGEAEPCNHSWGEGVETKAATCTEAGVKTYTCSKCSETKTETIAALGHNMENGSCTRCGETDSCNHFWRQGSTVSATCEKEGYTSYTCLFCKGTKKEVIPAKGHKYAAGRCYVCGKDAESIEYVDIANAADLIAFANRVNAGETTLNGRLTADIDLGGASWTPIGKYCPNGDSNASVCYKGRFNGNGHTVSNFTVAGTDCVGLIGYAEMAVIQNLGVVNVTATGWNAGAIAGYAPTSTIENCFAKDCKITGNTTNPVAINSEAVHVGAVAGSNSGTVKNCYAINCTLSITFDGQYNSMAPVGGSVRSNNYYCNVSGEFTATSGATEVSAAQMASGEVTYKLNKGVVDGSQAWYQTCGQGLPAFSGKTVYLDESNNTYVNELTVCDHSYSSSVTTEPTCTTDGVKTYTCSKCGDSYTESVPSLGHTEETVAGKDATCTETGLTAGSKCSVCGEVLVAQTEIPSLGHKYENGSCTVCGAADPDYNPVVVPSFSVLSKTLNLEGEVKYNMIFMANNTSSVKNMGLITFLSNPSDISIDSADYVIPGAVSASGMYMVGSQGIPAKNLGDTLYMVIYAELTDGSYAYSSVVPYSAKEYAYAQLAGTSISDNQRKLLVAMLNYGAEAQLAFGYNTDNLINADLAAMEIPEMVTYSNDLLDGCVSADSTKTVNFPAGGFHMNSATVSLEGALAINYLLMPANTPSAGMKVYYWTADTYNSASKLTIDNADGTLDSIVSSGMYMATYNGLAASQMGDTVYVAAVYENGGNTYTTGVISYSLAKYLTATADGTGTQKNLAAATVIYGYYANIEFPNV